jgi:hypothetical protein
MSDPTSTSTLQQLVPYLLPERGQPGSTLTAPTDLAAVLVHAIHTSLEFRLVRPITPSGSRNQSADTEEQDDDEGQQRRGEDTEVSRPRRLWTLGSSDSLPKHVFRVDGTIGVKIRTRLRTSTSRAG